MSAPHQNGKSAGTNGKPIELLAIPSATPALHERVAYPLDTAKAVVATRLSYMGMVVRATAEGIHVDRPTMPGRTLTPVDALTIAGMFILAVDDHHDLRTDRPVAR